MIKRLLVFKGKKVLVTGHTGFKGSWLCIWLKILGAKVYGISLEPTTQTSHYKATNLKKYLEKSFIFNINNMKKLKNTIYNIKPDFVFHLAGQSIVKLSYLNPMLTWNTNLIGTINILESLRKLNKCTVIFITSDKCYKNTENLKGYLEKDYLGGDDPYSASKASAEIAIHSYYKTFFKKSNILICSVRAGNVIGGGDWSPDRIIPDFFKAYLNKKKLVIRNPNSIRPWQHVLDALHGYLILAQKLHFDKKLSGEAFNFGPKKIKNFKVKNLIKYLNNDKIVEKKLILYKKSKNFKETNILKLNVKKSQNKLNWSCILDIKKSLDMTKEWFVKYKPKKFEYNYNLSKSQILDFIKLK